MKINNKTGFIHCIPYVAGAFTGGAGAAIAAKVAFGVIALACVWHIPAWSQAKANHTEAQYQGQKMWPQQFFATLPGGDNYVK